MPVSLKCAACGAEVQFEELSSTAEATCPGCEVRVRYREGDTKMAMPVSMTLPEKFRPVDLKAVAGKSSLLVGRYRKRAEEGGEAKNSDVALAKALETLANSIGHLEERLDRKDQDEKPATKKKAAKKKSAKTAKSRTDPAAGTPNGVKVVEGERRKRKKTAKAKEEAEVVQLAAEEQPAAPETPKATPVGARVLVRREAAREAQEFRREKHGQADWDSRAERSRGPSGFGWLMENYPKTTIMVTMLMAGALIVWTIVTMDRMFTMKSDKVAEKVKTRTTSLSQYFDDDPEAAQAEIMARGFLNATSAAAVAPFIFESEAIREQLDEYFEPISSPGDYELSLKSRALTPEGQSVFAYNVLIPGQGARRLVVLPEGNLPKVYWQFFAEVGEMSWNEFLVSRPSEPVEMRVWVYPGAHYADPYRPEEWQCYIMHDWAEKRQVYAYANRQSGENWRIADAFKNEPVKFNRHSAVMALVKIRFMAELPVAGGGPQPVVELKEVVATSWLPEQFRSARAKK